MWSMILILATLLWTEATVAIPPAGSNGSQCDSETTNLHHAAAMAAVPRASSPRPPPPAVEPNALLSLASGGSFTSSRRPALLPSRPPTGPAAGDPAPVRRPGVETAVHP